MAVARKLVVVPNSATRELWRIAESGESDELAAVLARADINARNEHGMTALMRAAHHGRVQIVRVLLEHGADPNIKRNDNFTALSLAAFFGHAEIVEILMRHGANTDVATRFGTSPHMWAKARSFGDVAKCLEKRSVNTKKSLSDKPAPLSEPPVAAKPPLAVKTLKDPPEIWDLVQEAPRTFDAGSAFMARLGSMKLRFVVPAAALFVMACVGLGAWLFLKDSVPTSAAPAAAAAEAPVPAPVAVDQPVTAVEPVVVAPADPSRETNNVVAETPVVVSQPGNAGVNPNVSRRWRPVATTRAISDEVNVQPEEGVETVAAPPVVTSSVDSGTTETKKSAAPVNPHIVSPPKSAQPKAKVIQWP